MEPGAASLCDDDRASPDGDAAEATSDVGAASSSRAPGAPVETLAKRRDFLAASRARRAGAASLNLQGRRRAEGEKADPVGVRVGYTCSKKVGDAVRRNRAKRRLRAAAALVLPRLGRPGWDYVLIGKPEVTAARPFPALLADLEAALARVHGEKGRGDGGGTRAARPAP